MKRCDLHNHSNCSDGSDTPREVVLYAKEKGLCAVALTDHNTVAGLKEFTDAAKEFGIEYIFGSELTTDYNGKEVHLLSMFITKENAHRVKEFTDIQLERKRSSNVDLEKNLRNSGYDVSLRELKEKYGENINRAHFAKEFVNKGYFKTTDEAFNTILKSGNGYYHPPKRLTLFEAIELVKSWECVSVIAHPLLSVTKEELEELLPVAIEKGLCGIEVYYPKFSEEEKNYLHVLARNYGLIESGGSDYHGVMKTNVDMDDACVPYKCYEELYRKYLSLI